VRPPFADVKPTAAEPSEPTAMQSVVAATHVMLSSEALDPPGRPATAQSAPPFAVHTSSLAPDELTARPAHDVALAHAISTRSRTLPAPAPAMCSVLKEVPRSVVFSMPPAV